jgi:hypothetical protein
MNVKATACPYSGNTKVEPVGLDRNGTRDAGRGATVHVASANSFACLPGKIAIPSRNMHPWEPPRYLVSRIISLPKGRGYGSQKYFVGLGHDHYDIPVSTVCPTRVHMPLTDERLRKNPQGSGDDPNHYPRQTSGWV